MAKDVDSHYVNKYWEEVAKSFNKARQSNRN